MPSSPTHRYHQDCESDPVAAGRSRCDPSSSFRAPASLTFCHPLQPVGAPHRPRRMWPTPKRRARPLTLTVHSTPRYSTVLHGTPQYSTVLHSTPQYSVPEAAGWAGALAVSRVVVTVKPPRSLPVQMRHVRAELVLVQMLQQCAAPSRCGHGRRRLQQPECAGRRAHSRSLASI